MKKPDDKPFDPDDRGAFRAWAADVTPLPRRNQARLARPLPQPIPEQRLREDRQTLVDSLSDTDAWEAGYETGEELNFVRDGVAREVLRQLRGGHWVIQDELDLHGLTSAEARPLVVEFLNECRRDGIRCVRIIHGKGLRSKNQEPVLKKKMVAWLAQRDEVLAFCQARVTEGGGGAVVVLLRGTP
jgi:DNA-nicking Smr family endonuclease